MNAAADTPIAALLYGARGEGDRALGRIARSLAEAGATVAGLIQVAGPAPSGCAPDMVLQSPDGAERFVISERRGASSRGCRLDSSALEAAAGRLAGMIEAGADIVVLSKFGRREAEGRGFRQALEAAMLAGLPVLTGVSAEYRAAFEAFAGDLGRVLDDEAAALAWARAAVPAASRRAPAAADS